VKDNLKAMVLAAGVGSRLDPLTKRFAQASYTSCQPPCHGAHFDVAQ
jgi:dTDP-glucose pyrophosphorylase